MIIQKCWLVFLNLWIIAIATASGFTSDYPYKKTSSLTMKTTPTPPGVPPGASPPNDKPADLKIRVYSMVGKDQELLSSEDQEPKLTVTIPGLVLKIGSKLIPASAHQAMKEQGVDMEEIIRLSKNPEARGTLMEVENHEEKERVVIGLE